MKKLVYLMAFVAMVFGMMGCSLITQSNNEYWIHDWGHDGYDYLWLKPNGKCNYYFGDLTEHTNCTYKEQGSIVTLYNEQHQVERILDRETGLVTTPHSSYDELSMLRVEEDEFKEFVVGRDMYGEAIEEDFDDSYDEGYDESDYDEGYDQADNGNYVGGGSDDRDDEYLFRSAYDVMNYLSGVTFTDGNGIRLQFKYDGLYANNTPITGAIEVVEFNAVEAILNCTGIDGTRFRFHLVQDMLVKELNGGGIYYMEK